MVDLVEILTMIHILPIHIMLSYFASYSTLLKKSIRKKQLITSLKDKKKMDHLKEINGEKLMQDSHIVHYLHLHYLINEAELIFQEQPNILKNAKILMAHLQDSINNHFVNFSN